MPLGYLTGLERKYPFNWMMKKLPFENILYIGIRAIQRNAEEMIRRHAIKVITVDNIKLNGIGKILGQIREIVGTRPVHISFDVDSLDTQYVTCTGTIAEDGLNLEDVVEIITFLKPISMDITEYNPSLGTDEECRRSLDNTIKIIRAYIG